MFTFINIINIIDKTQWRRMAVTTRRRQQVISLNFSKPSGDRYSVVQGRSPGTGSRLFYKALLFDLLAVFFRPEVPHCRQQSHRLILLCSALATWTNKMSMVYESDVIRKIAYWCKFQLVYILVEWKTRVSNVMWECFPLYFKLRRP